MSSLSRRLMLYSLAVSKKVNKPAVRYATTTSSGAFHPQPTKVPFGLVGATGMITFGLLLGAAISKNIASFLEENELFVPSDDDDDD